MLLSTECREERCVTTLLVMFSNVKLYLKCDLFSVMKSSHKARDHSRKQLQYINSERQSFISDGP